MMGTCRGPRRRRWALALTLAVGAFGLIFLLPASPAAAACPANPLDCEILPGVGPDLDCKEPPPPVRPDNGVAGWFLSEPKKIRTGDPFAKDANVSVYDVYGYAGLGYETYDLGCGGAARNAGASSTTYIANLIMAPAMFLVGLDNSVREYAYRPNSMWGWTNDFVQRASDALRDRVFTVWGAVVLGIVGLWLLWGARGGNLSQAAVTAGWAIMVMAVVTAVAAWPVKASTAADNTLTGALGQISSGLSRQSADDDREPAVRASGVLTETVLYDQWLRGTLGSADSETARKYGPDLYRARSISWAEAKEMRKGADERKKILEQKGKLWTETAEKVKDEDPDAYEYLVGRKGSERVGAAMLATISAIVVTPFDLMASLLILVAFLIIRLAVAFLPAIGTIGILRPASGPLRGLLRTVLAAFINCIIFGAGSAVFLLAVEVITGTSSLAGWQQVLLIWLTGLILWLLLRPYRRLTQLTGMDPFGELAGGLGRMHKKVFGDMKQLAIASAGAYIGDVHALDANEQKKLERGNRPENWSRKAARQHKREQRQQEVAQDAQYSAAASSSFQRMDRDGAAHAEQVRADMRAADARAGAAGRRPETASTAAASASSPDGRGKSGPPIVVTRRHDPEQFDGEYHEPVRPPSIVAEDSGLVADGESRVIYRPDRGYTRVSDSSRVSQAAANIASAASAAREVALAAGALARESRQRPDG